MGNIKQTYSDLLNNPKWIERRNEILSRDRNTCQLCGARDRYLHVHHKYYTEGAMPWEYGDDALVTLCDKCHSEIHQESDGKFDYAHIGDIFRMFHSDYENVCVVYHIDYKNELVYTIEYDNGAGTDTIYGECNSFFEFWEKYHDVESGLWDLDDYFRRWFANVRKNLDKTTPLIRIRFDELLRRNKFLRYIIESGKYETEY